MSEPDFIDEREDESDGYCQCGSFHSIVEIDCGQCDCCGYPISPEEYS